jgi:hypothetical protein
MSISRRTVVAGAVGLAAAAGALAYEGWRLFGRHYPPTPYDDLLALLPERAAARQLGAAFVSQHPDFHAATAARALRQHIGNHPLQSALVAEIARGQITEAGHWVLPQTLVGLCALAAKV